MFQKMYVPDRLRLIAFSGWSWGAAVCRSFHGADFPVYAPVTGSRPWIKASAAWYICQALAQ
jgi:hypothetical protein